MELELSKFIKSTPDWETVLQEEYKLKISRKGEYILFKYGIGAKFDLQMIREARGIIFHEPTMIPVCVPFFKFGNYGESYVPDIDWNTAVVQEKLDGSLIKVWFDAGEWHVSTNGTIDAFDAPLDGLSPYNSFGELFIESMLGKFDFHDLNRAYCYMFELCSPYNKVVVPHKEIKLYHIGTRNMVTLEEVKEVVGYPLDIPSPKHFELMQSDLIGVINLANELPFDEEGYVVVDADWNRVKIKSPAYVSAHHLRGEGVMTWKRIVEMVVMTDESKEFLTYYPEYAPMFKSVESILYLHNQQIAEALDYINRSREYFMENRKALAEYGFGVGHAHYIFAWWDGKANDYKEWLRGLKGGTDAIVKVLGLKDYTPFYDDEEK